jgi:hypothetical protein
VCSARYHRERVKVEILPEAYNSGLNQSTFEAGIIRGDTCVCGMAVYDSIACDKTSNPLQATTDWGIVLVTVGSCGSTRVVVVVVSYVVYVVVLVNVVCT